MFLFWMKSPRLAKDIGCFAFSQHFACPDILIWNALEVGGTGDGGNEKDEY